MIHSLDGLPVAGSIKGDVGNLVLVSIGRQGNYTNRAIWRRLGWARDRIFEVAITDPVKAVIVSANLKASAGDN